VVEEEAELLRSCSMVKSFVDDGDRRRAALLSEVASNLFENSFHD